MRDLLTKDFGWKILALFLAAVIWFTVKNISSEPAPVNAAFGIWETRTLTNWPILVVSAAADVREFKVQPDNVAITFTARPEVMAAMQVRDIEAHVDLTDIESAPRGVRTRVIVSTPAGVALVRVDPPDVDVVIPSKKKTK
jgi:YbbR domain-containing protein